jgi:hypothetical protein
MPLVMFQNVFFPLVRLPRPETFAPWSQATAWFRDSFAKQAIKELAGPSAHAVAGRSARTMAGRIDLLTDRLFAIS